MISWESFSYKIHIWFWSKLVITLVRVRAFLSMTNANTNSVRAGQRSFSENNFLQFKLRLVDPRYMRVLYNLSHHPSCQIPLSAVFVLNSNSASVPSFLTFDWSRFEPRQVIGIFRFFWADYSCWGTIISGDPIIRSCSVHKNLYLYSHSL